jgi:hypothetical protein
MRYYIEVKKISKLVLSVQFWRRIEETYLREVEVHKVQQNVLHYCLL